MAGEILPPIFKSWKMNSCQTLLGFGIKEVDAYVNENNPDILQSRIVWEKHCGPQQDCSLLTTNSSTSPSPPQWQQQQLLHCQSKQQRQIQKLQHWQSNNWDNRNFSTWVVCSNAVAHASDVTAEKQSSEALAMHKRHQRVEHHFVGMARVHTKFLNENPKVQHSLTSVTSSPPNLETNHNEKVFHNCLQSYSGKLTSLHEPNCLQRIITNFSLWSQNGKLKLESCSCWIGQLNVNCICTAMWMQSFWNFQCCKVCLLLLVNQTHWLCFCCQFGFAPFGIQMQFWCFVQMPTKCQSVQFAVHFLKVWSFVLKWQLVCVDFNCRHNPQQEAFDFHHFALHQLVQQLCHSQLHLNLFAQISEWQFVSCLQMLAFFNVFHCVLQSDQWFNLLAWHFHWHKCNRSTCELFQICILYFVT